MIDEEKNHNFQVGDHAKALLTINIEDNPSENDAEDKLTSELADLEWSLEKEDKDNQNASETESRQSLFWLLPIGQALCQVLHSHH